MPDAKKTDDKLKPVPAALKVDRKTFETIAKDGEVYGGSSDILSLDEDTGAGPLTYAAFRADVNLGNDLEPVDIHEATDREGNRYRLPIASSFRRQAEEAQLVKGDTFVLFRNKDEKKKNGKGKGIAMQMYQIVVQSRVPRPAVATA